MWSMPPVRLFAGHPQDTLMEIARAIGRVQPLSPPPLPTGGDPVHPTVATTAAAAPSARTSAP